jgi:probable HAF family extracellular repeat protein
MSLRLANIKSRIFRSLAPPRQRPPGCAACNRTRLGIEALEDRCLPSGYSITEITAIGQDYPNGVTGSPNPVSAINSATVTQVTGTAAAAPGAYVWDSVHGLQQIGTVRKEADSAATSMNRAGQVVGISSTTTEIYDRKSGYYYRSYTENGFLWSSSAGMKDLGSNVDPEAINNSGQIAGNPSSGTQGAMLWNGKTWVPLGDLPGGAYSRAFGINDYGQVAGYGQIQNNSEDNPNAFLWTPSSPNSTSGSMINLGTLTSGWDSTAVAINSQGWVTGNAGVPISQPIGDIIGVGHAFLWRPSSANGTTGTMIDLGTLDPKADGGLGQSWGLAINSGGVIVGQSNPTGATSEYQTDAVIWQPGSNGSYSLSDLNSLIPSGSGWALRRADAINDSGDIVAEAANSGFSGLYALLLTPSTTTTALTAATTSTQTQLATTSTARPPIAHSGGTSSAPLLASPPTGGSSIDPSTVSVAMSLSQIPGTLAAAASPVLGFSPAPL